MKTCKTCAAFVEIKDSQNGAGKCHVDRPQALINMFVTDQILNERGAIVQVLRGLVDGFFPPTRADLFCLKWTAREDVEAQEAIPGSEPLAETPAVGLAAGLGVPETTH